MLKKMAILVGVGVAVMLGVGVLSAHTDSGITEVYHACINGSGGTSGEMKVTRVGDTMFRANQECGSN